MNNRNHVLLSNSPLVNYALKGLEQCWLPHYGRWSHIYHLDNRNQPNESVPQSDVFYTLNVLLGLARVRQIPKGVNVPETFERNVSQLLRLPVSKYAFGMALWTAAELGLELPGDLLRHVQTLISDDRQLRSFRAQDLGMIIVGVVAQARLDPKKWSPLATRLFAFLMDRFCSSSGLFFDAAFGVRRRYASFATQTYLLLACYAYGELMSDDRAIEIANRGTLKVISLQGPRGEWPWFFDAATGLVVDFYEVYSVHQYGMAPAFLERAEQHGILQARGAIIKGFNWVLGQNQLATPMLVPDLHLTIRSQVRKGELHTKKWRVLRALGISLSGREAGFLDPTDVVLRRECRSYELGWILWSFGQRSDLPELTHHESFIDATEKQEIKNVS